jgi:hypothetical protein
LSAVTYDQLRALYRTLLVFATVGVVILSVGLVEFVYFEPPGQTTGAKAHIVGVFRYDPGSGAATGGDRSEFGRTEQFAAQVDWASIPSNLTVDARWYDSFGAVEGAAGPGSPADLGGRPLVPVTVPQGFHYVLPGRYTFVVERLNNGVPVEVLGRRFVVVDRS